MNRNSQQCACLCCRFVLASIMGVAWRSVSSVSLCIRNAHPRRAVLRLPSCGAELPQRESLCLGRSVCNCRPGALQIGKGAGGVAKVSKFPARRSHALRHVVRLGETPRPCAGVSGTRLNGAQAAAHQGANPVCAFERAARSLAFGLCVVSPKYGRCRDNWRRRRTANSEGGGVARRSRLESSGGEGCGRAHRRGSLLGA